MLDLLGQPHGQAFQVRRNGLTFSGVNLNKTFSRTELPLSHLWPNGININLKGCDGHSKRGRCQLPDRVPGSCK